MFRYTLLFVICFFFNPLQGQETDKNQEKILINKIYIKGNENTKDYILLRELTFQVSDSVISSEIADQLERSRQNLLNTSLFNFVTLQKVHVDSASVNVIIEVIERWYFWPLPILELAETNFNTWWIKKDFTRINYGAYLVKENFRGRKETVKLKFQWGFTQNIGLQYSVPFINKKRTIGAAVSFAYARNHEVNYKSLNNKRQFYKDETKFLKQDYFTRFTLSCRSKLYNTHSFDIDYVNVFIDDTLQVLTTNYFKNNEKSTQYVGLNYWFRYDKRDFAAYPLKGHLFDLYINKYGLGTAIENNLNVLVFSGRLTNHYHIIDRLYAATGLFGKTTAIGTPVYFNQRGLGYSELVRGYEYYVIDGQHYALLKTNLKYQLIKPHRETVNFINTERFNTFHYALYVNLFADAGYVADRLYAKENPLANKLMTGGGIGLDLVTYYDMIMRVELSVNRMKETGIYFNFVKSI